MSDLWESHPLQSLVTKVGSGSTPRGGSEAYKAVGTPLIRSMNVVFFGFKRKGLVYIDDEQAAQLDNAVVKAGDVLLNITGASIGRVTLAPDEFEGARVNQHVCVIRPNEALDARFLNAYLSSPALQDQIWNDNFGVTRQALTKQQILDFEIPLPAKAEQVRIVNQLDTLLARVQACNDRFDAIPALLKRFRRTVLDAAFSGQLYTEMMGTSPRESYPRIRLSEIAESRLGKMLDRQKNTGTPTLYIGNINVRWFSFDLANLQQIFIEEREKKGLEIRDGDVFICEGGEPGRCAIWDAGTTDIVFQKALHRVRPFKDRLLPQWLAYCIRHMTDTEQLKPLFTGTTIRHLTGASLAQVLIPLPDINEQTEIIHRVEALFAMADRIEAKCTAARAHAQRLTPLVLGKAFRGELVPQDPSDEPASELLARIGLARTVVAKPEKKMPTAIFNSDRKI